MSSRSYALPESGVAVHLGGDVGGEVGVLVDAGEAGPDRGERVRRLPADALAGPEHDEATAVEAQQTGVVGDGGVVGAGHRAPTRASTVAFFPAPARLRHGDLVHDVEVHDCAPHGSGDGRRRYLASPSRSGERSTTGIDPVSYGLGRRRSGRSRHAA